MRRTTSSIRARSQNRPQQQVTTRVVRRAQSPQATAAGFFAHLDYEHGQGLFDALEGVYFFIKDADGRYLRANRTMCASHGLADEAQIIGRTDHDFTPRHLADHYVRDDQRVLAGEAVWDRVELVLRHRGCPDWYVTSKIPLRTPAGDIVGLAGVSRHLGQAASKMLPYARLTPALEHVRVHFAERIEVVDLARACHLSTRQFQRSFQDTFEMPPREYLRQFRLGHGIDLLIGSDAPITAIAQQAGFTDHSHFARAFVRAMGVSPGAYRRKYRHT
jgi:PAS domain S-box-containing protein